MRKAVRDRTEGLVTAMESAGLKDVPMKKT